MRFGTVLICLLLAVPVRAQELMQFGIFGTVEGLAPLIVAGRQIDVPEGLRVLSVLGPEEGIAKGDTLAVVAQVRDARLVATRILHVFAIIGPVRGLSDGTLSVMGTWVEQPQNMDLAEGQWVAVSGLWSGDTVITTQLRRMEGGGFGQITGVVEQAQTLGTTALRVAQLPEGGFGHDLWILGGAPEEDALVVRMMSKGVFGGAVDLALWQGHASAPIASQTYMIHGTGISGTARDAQMPVPGALVTRCAVSGRVVTEPPEGLEAGFAALGCATHTPAE